MTLGETILRLRTQAGLSQADLAEHLEVSRQSVSKWETNASVPDLDKLVKLSELFRISLDELVTGRAPAAPAPQPAPAAPLRRTPAQTAGMVILIAASVLFVLFTLMGAMLFGLLLALFLCVPGLICLFVKRRPWLWCSWTTFLMADAFTACAMGIRAQQILYTFQWTSSMNYLRLAIAWVLFLVLAALVVTTAYALRAGGENPRREKGTVIFAIILFLLASLPLRIDPLQFYTSMGWILNLIWLLRDWGQLAALTLLAACLSRWLYRKKHTASL